MQSIFQFVPRPTRPRPLPSPRSLFVAIATTIALSISATGMADATPVVTQPEFTDATHPSVSGDGRVVVFEATADDGRRSVYSLDVDTRSVSELSERPNGRRRGDTVQPVLSDDGCVVGVTTEVAFDLFRDDDHGDRWDAYRLVLPHCGGTRSEWELVSTTRDGTATDNVTPASRLAVSGSGTTIAYTATRAVEGSELSSLHVVDLTVPSSDERRTISLPTPPSMPTNPLPGTRGATDPSISDDGTLVAFSADYDASLTIPDWLPVDALTSAVVPQAFVWSGVSGSTTLISPDGGVRAAAGARRPILSGDGNYVFVESAEPSWVTAEGWRCDSTCGRQVFRFDLRGVGATNDSDPPTASGVGSPRLVTGRPTAPGAAGQPGNRPAYLIDVSGNGDQVAFATSSTNLTDWGLLDRSRRGRIRRDEIRVFIADIGPENGRAVGRETLRAIIPTPPTTVGDVIASSVRLTADGNTAIYATRLRTTASLTDNAGSALGTYVTAPTIVMPALDFGSITVGSESGELFTTVQNLGPGSFAPTEVRSESPAFRISGGTCTTAVVVAVGDSCSVRVIFSPLDENDYTGQISVSDAAGRAATTALAGVGGQPALRLDPGGLDLGLVAVGTSSAPAEVRIANIGFEPVTVEEIRLSDTNRDDFKLASDECTGNKLGPQQSCAIAISFAPSAAGLRTASVVATTSGGSRSAAVVGGWGTFHPTVTTSKETVRPNDKLEIRGEGFGAAEVVSIIVSGALAEPILVTTDPNGAFGVPVTVSADALAGPTVVTVRSGSGTFASTTLRVLALPPSVTFVPEHRVA